MWYIIPIILNLLVAFIVKTGFRTLGSDKFTLPLIVWICFTVVIFIPYVNIFTFIAVFIAFFYAVLNEELVIKDNTTLSKFLNFLTKEI